MITDANEPTFLRKLKAQYGGANAVRQERPVARPQKRFLDGDEDDQPTYVDEESHDTISKDEYEALVRGAGPEDKESHDELEGAKAPESDPSNTTSKDAELSTEQIQEDVDKSTTFGSTNKKRKVKAIGGDSEEPEPASREQVADEAPKKGKSKKGKKIKLSFDLEE